MSVLPFLPASIVGGLPGTHSDNQMLRFDGANTKKTQTCTNFFCDDNGNVNIGTTGLTSKLNVKTTTANQTALHISGEDNSTTITSSYPVLEVINTANTNNMFSVISFADSPSGAAAALMGTKIIDTTNNYGEYHFWTRGSSGFGTRLFIDSNGNIGINEASPITLLEMTHATPYISLHCSTETDTAGARASRIIARGEQSGGEETMLGFQEFAHDGSSDDEKGYYRICLNDGNDGESPTERLRILSNGNIGIGTTTQTHVLEIAATANTTPVKFGANGYLSNFGDTAYLCGGCEQTSGIWTARSTSAAIVALNDTGTINYYTNSGLTSGNTFTPTFRLYLGNDGKFGINENSPITLMELTHAAPFISLHCSTETDTAGARASRIIARGEQSGGEETMLGFQEFAHDGSSNDEKGYYRICLNDGNNGESPTERIRVLSNGNVGIGTIAPDKTLEINAATGGTIRGTYNDGNGSASDHWDIATGANGEFTLTTTDGDGTAGDITFSPDGLVKITTDMIFSGAGSGMPYGCIAGDDETVTCTDQSTYYQVTFDTVGCENLMTGSTDDNDITVQKTGIYRMTAIASFHSAVAHDFEFQVKKNDGASDVPHAHSYQTTSVSNQVEGTAISVICSLTANDTLELWVQCTDAAGQNCIFDHVNLCANMLGG